MVDDVGGVVMADTELEEMAVESVVSAADQVET